VNHELARGCREGAGPNGPKPDRRKGDIARLGNEPRLELYLPDRAPEHGGEAFPDVEFVLQGYGVTIDLVGDTFIDGKTGITSATFRNTPDVPFESIEVTLPTGPDSEFGANLPASAKESFCGQNLKMPDPLQSAERPGNP
jgi:hypothetical protein